MLSARMSEKSTTTIPSASGSLTTIPIKLQSTLDFTTRAEEAGLRLDKMMSGRAPDFSRSRLQDLIKRGHLQIDGLVVVDSSRKVKADQSVVLQIPEPEPAGPLPQAIDLAIVYEDEYLIVINKPAGLVVHPAAGHADGTLVNALIAHCGESLSGIGGVKRPGIVHRLDKDTSGLLVVAKTDLAHKKLAAQFADHGRTGPLQRAYLAFVWGVPNRAHGTINANLERSHVSREKIAVVSDERGREAITHFEVKQVFNGCDAAGNITHPGVASMVECRLETGRTHQIRVHMAHIGHPLLADQLYGSGYKTKAVHLGEAARDALRQLGGRQALHAALLGFEHPRSKAELVFETELPDDLEQLRASLTK